MLAKLKKQYESGAMLNQGSSDDESSSSTDEEIENRLNKIAQQDSSKCGKMQLRTAFRAKIYQLAGPVGLVELNEDFKQLSQHGLLQAETLLSNFDSDFYDLQRQIL